MHACQLCADSSPLGVVESVGLYGEGGTVLAGRESKHVPTRLGSLKRVTVLTARRKPDEIDLAVTFQLALYVHLGDSESSVGE